MCGIFAVLNAGHNERETTSQLVEEAFAQGQARGPEYSQLQALNPNIILGFHRLAINGLGADSNQPFHQDNVSLVCNGEIYNFRELIEKYGLQVQSNSDCEVILHLYLMLGINETLSLLDGVFAFVLVDRTNGRIYAARDRFGVRPLYMLQSKRHYTERSVIGIASEMKSLIGLVKDTKNYIIEQVEPRTVIVLSQRDANVTFASEQYNYYDIPHTAPEYGGLPPDDYIANTHKGIVKFLNAAVQKRVHRTTDRPVACLLSGGLDSSLIAALVNKYYQRAGHTLETYSIGMAGSEDLRYADLVALHLGTKHTSIVLTEDDFFAAIPEVVKAIESYDTTSVRASVGNYLVAKYIRANSDAKVIFNGDGSDELTGGYLYMLSAPNDQKFDLECRRLLRDIYLFDVLRSDKCISSNGLEPRTPFLDSKWVEYYLSICTSLRNPNNIKGTIMEKQLLRQAFANLEPHLLPPQVLWRRKEAFSDGVSGTQKPWYMVIQDRLHAQGRQAMEGLTVEQTYYRELFETYYPHQTHIVPYYWMPRFVQATDPSARTLASYGQAKSN